MKAVVRTRLPLMRHRVYAPGLEAAERAAAERAARAAARREAERALAAAMPGYFSRADTTDLEVLCRLPP